MSLKEADVEWVILGHSERRMLFGGTSHFVAQNIVAALDCDLDVIICMRNHYTQPHAAVVL